MHRNCEECHAALLPGDLFCSNCGAPMPRTAHTTAASASDQVRTCQKCGNSSHAGSLFCIHCGAPVTSSATQTPPEASTHNAGSRPQGPPNTNRTTYQSPIRDGNTFRCPQCNGELTSGLKICPACRVTFLYPVPYINARVPEPTPKPAPVPGANRGSGMRSSIGFLVICGMAWFGGSWLRDHNKGMSGRYVDAMGLSSIVFESDGKYWYHGLQDFNGVYDLQDHVIYLRPQQEVIDRLTPDEKNNPWMKFMMNQMSATVSEDKNTLDIMGVSYHKQ